MFQASDSERSFCRCRDKMSMYDLPFTSSTSSSPAQNALSFWRSLKPVWIWESSTFNSHQLPVLKSRKFLCLLKGCRLQNGRVGCCCDYLLVASIPPRRLVRGFIFIGSWVLLKSHLSHACHTYYPAQEMGEIIRGSHILCQLYLISFFAKDGGNLDTLDATRKLS